MVFTNYSQKNKINTFKGSSARQCLLESIKMYKETVRVNALRYKPDNIYRNPEEQRKKSDL